MALSSITRDGKIEDGFIRPYQLENFRLNGLIVVFSACDNAGKQVPGEGIARFAGSQFEARASRIVLNLAEIDTAASSKYFSEV